MSKLYKWLATGHLGFLKIFGHFYKMPCYLISGQNIFTEKEKQKKKERRDLPVLGPASRSQAQPTKGSLVFFPGRPSTPLRGMHAGDAHGHLLLPPSSSPRLEKALDASSIPPPSPLALPLCLSRFCAHPKPRRSAAAACSWPTASPPRPVLSRSSATSPRASLQKESGRSPPKTTPASSPTPARRPLVVENSGASSTSSASPTPPIASG